MRNHANRFYVYVLFDRLGVPRYVGKGHGSRWLQHDSGRDPVNHRKNEFVLETIATIGEVPKVKIREHLLENEAFDIESTLIRALGRFPNGPLLNLTDKRNGPSSECIRQWHASRTAEERRRHMEPAIKASLASPGRQEKNKDLIQFALAALTPAHHLMAAKRLNDGYTPKKRVAAAFKRIAATTPAERSAIASKSISSQTTEQLSRTGRRRNEFITPEVRSAIGRKRAAHLTAEQRATNTERLRHLQTSEQLSENGKKGAASLTQEIRSAASKKRAETLGPERLREISLKAVEGRRLKKAARLQLSTT